MRVLFLSYEYPPLGGGAGNAAEYLLRELSEMPGISLDVVTSSVNNAYRFETVNNSLTIHFLPVGEKRNTLKRQSIWELLLYTFRSYRLCKKLISEKQYDGVHVFFTVPCGAIAWRLWKRFRIPYIVSLRGSDVPGYSEKYALLYPFLRSLIRVIWKYAGSVVSNSAGLRSLAHRTNPDQSIEVIYNGVDTKTFTPFEGERDLKTYTILCASRLEKRKGFRYVVEALDILKDRHPQIRLLIAGGDGGAEEELRSLVKEKNLSDRVDFFGEFKRSDLVKLQQKSDVFVFPSFNEGMSNNLLEALAGGLPVLMTPTGGAEELVRDGENGYIIRFADSRDIAEKLELLLRNPELMKQMGAKSREIAKEMSWQSVANAYRSLYEKVFG